MIKKCWMTAFPTNESLLTLSLESEYPEQPHNRILINQILFPNNPSKEFPMRHVVQISLLNEEDINKLAQLLDQYRTDV